MNAIRFQYCDGNRDIMRIAMEQSAEDMGCRPEDFWAADNVVVPLRLGARARAYCREPILCSFISCGGNIAAATTDGKSREINAEMQLKTPKLRFRDFGNRP